MTGTEARSLGDSSVKMAQVYGPASYIALEEASTGQRVSKSANAPKGRFYLIVLHGHFVCDTCSHLTAASIRGTIATQIWSPTSREGDFGLGHRSLPASMSRLGTPTVISLG